MDRNERGKQIVKWLKETKQFKTQADMARAIGYNHTVISAAMSGKIVLSDKMARAICSVNPQINQQWLLTGEGEMLLSEPQRPQPSGRQHRAPLYRELSVSAGQMEQWEYDDTHEEICIGNVTAEAVFPVIGHSMEPYIYEGDLVGVVSIDSWERLNPDRIYLIITRDNERMIKHIAPTHATDETITLLSDNPAYGPFEVEKQQILRIMKVVFSARTYR